MVAKTNVGRNLGKKKHFIYLIEISEIRIMKQIPKKSKKTIVSVDEHARTRGIIANISVKTQEFEC